VRDKPARVGFDFLGEIICSAWWIDGPSACRTRRTRWWLDHELVEVFPVCICSRPRGRKCTSARWGLIAPAHIKLDHVGTKGVDALSSHARATALTSATLPWIHVHQAATPRRYRPKTERVEKVVHPAGDKLRRLAAGRRSFAYRRRSFRRSGRGLRLIHAICRARNECSKYGRL